MVGTPPILSTSLALTFSGNLFVVLETTYPIRFCLLKSSLCRRELPVHAYIVPEFSSDMKFPKECFLSLREYSSLSPQCQ